MIELAPEVVMPEEGLDPIARRYQEQLGMPVDEEAAFTVVDNRGKNTYDEQQVPDLNAANSAEQAQHAGSAPETAEHEATPKPSNAKLEANDKDGASADGAEKGDEEPEDVKAVREMSKQDFVRLVQPTTAEDAVVQASISDPAWAAAKRRRAELIAEQPVAEGQTSRTADEVHDNDSEALDQRRAGIRDQLQKAHEAADKGEPATAEDAVNNLAERIVEHGLDPNQLMALAKSTKANRVNPDEFNELRVGLDGYENKDGKHVDGTWELGIKDGEPTDFAVQFAQWQSAGKQAYAGAKTMYLSLALQRMSNDPEMEKLKGEALLKYCADMLDNIDDVTFDEATQNKVHMREPEQPKGPEQKPETPEEAPKEVTEEEVAKNGLLKRIRNKFRRTKEDETQEEPGEESAEEDTKRDPSAADLYAQLRDVRKQAHRQHRQEIGEQVAGDLHKVGHVAATAGRIAAGAVVETGRAVGKVGELTPRGKRLAFYEEQFGPLSDEQQTELKRPASERKAQRSMANLDLTTNSDGEPRQSYRQLREEIAQEEPEEEEDTRFQGVPLANERGQRIGRHRAED